MSAGTILLSKDRFVGEPGYFADVLGRMCELVPSLDVETLSWVVVADEGGVLTIELEALDDGEEQEDRR